MNRMSFFTCASAGLMIAAVMLSNASTASNSEIKGEALKPLSHFNEIADQEQRSVALFVEMGKVISHPRCANCHPRTDTPLQGEKGALHQPKVMRGMKGMGVAGMNCSTCHGAKNFGNVPGNPNWHLAPAEMAWAGVALDKICTQIKDPKRNGGMDMDALHKHISEDSLVGYAWNPPSHLQPAPGSQKQLGKLTRAWIDSGAHCPTSALEQEK